MSHADLQSPERPELILFDWDGTLVDSYGFLKAAHNHVRGHYNLSPWDDQGFKAVLRHSTREIYGQLYGENEKEATDLLRRYVDSHHAESLHLMTGAAELIDFLRQNGTNAGVVSNKRHERLAEDVKTLGWEDALPVVVGAGRALRDKPAPDPVLLAIEEAGFSGDMKLVWYVGDTITDMESASAAGVCAVFVAHGMGNFEDVSHLRPKHVFQNLDGVRSFLEKI